MPRDQTIPANVLNGQVRAAADCIASACETAPRVGIILGTGLGAFAGEFEQARSLSFGEVPHFPSSTAPGHAGRVTCGRMNGTPVLAMEGRVHLYEEYPAWQITLPVRVMHRLGIETLILSNAAGGVNPYYRVGDVMLIGDHINLLGANLLTGETSQSLAGGRVRSTADGPAGVGCCPYDEQLIQQAEAIARRENFACHRGVYAALSGPNYETRAEYRMLRRIGADAVGMSTVPEAIVASQLGLRVLALSTITNVCLPDALERTDSEEVIAAACNAGHKLRTIVLGILGLAVPEAK